MTALRWSAAILGLCLAGGCARKVDESPGPRSTPGSTGTPTTTPAEPSKPEEAPPPVPVDEARESGKSTTAPHTDEIPSESQLDLATVEITLVHSPCFGWCPDYTVVIEGSGRVRYSGRQYVKMFGDREGRLPVTAVRELVNGFRQSNFFALKSQYDDRVSDLPATFLTFRAGDLRKVVGNSWLGEHNYPSGEEVPDWKVHEMLDALAASIDRAVGIERWIGTHEERERLFSLVGSDR